MFFWKYEQETSLSAAILHDDLKTIKKLCGRKDHIYAKNYLGFDALEIAYYLGKQECWEILKPQSKHQIKVLPPNTNKVQVIDEEEFENFFHVRYLSHLKFEDYKQFKKVLKNCPSALRQFLKRTHQYKREILEGFVADVTIQWIDEVLGYGLFTNRDLREGDLVGEYVGEVQRVHRFHRHLSEYCLQYPLKKWFSIYVIDSAFQGNELRFINHSYEPNLVPKVAADRGLLHSLFFANQNISRGAQLTWNYGEDFWSSREPPVEIKLNAKTQRR
ncbi:MAG: hypothetical protein K940chlam7_01536, partial [Chlamydiae bacterium]|nr:hypothetical protein [Chlamydiota bacterium]